MIAANAGRPADNTYRAGRTGQVWATKEGRAALTGSASTSRSSISPPEKRKPAERDEDRRR